MSLLEDVFLQDETEEAQQLERVIEGDEYEERPRSLSPESDGSAKEDEAEEDKRRVDPKSIITKRVIKNPRFVLNPARLTGPRGIQIIPEHFKDFKFKGKGHEKEDLDLVLKRLEHWAYRLYPKFDFVDCLKKIESLGKKRPVMVHLHKIRSDQFTSEDTVVQKDSSDDEAPQPLPEEDEFDKLLQQQIDLARSTPAPGSAAKPGSNTPKEVHRSVPTTLMMPKATSSPSLNEEQKERMLRNKRLAEERRLAKLGQIKESTTTAVIEEVILETDVELSKKEEKGDKEEVLAKKHNRLNIIESSDDENDIVMENQSVTVDIHELRHQENVDHNESHENVCANKDISIKNTDVLHDTNSKISVETNNLNEISVNKEQTVEKDIFTDKGEGENIGSDNIYINSKDNTIYNVTEVIPNDESAYEKDNSEPLLMEQKQNETINKIYNKVIETDTHTIQEIDTPDKCENHVGKTQNIVEQKQNETINKIYNKVIETDTHALQEIDTPDKCENHFDTSQNIVESVEDLMDVDFTDEF